jgi:hypothetical protein
MLRTTMCLPCAAQGAVTIDTAAIDTPARSETCNGLVCDLHATCCAAADNFRNTFHDSGHRCLEPTRLGASLTRFPCLHSLYCPWARSSRRPVLSVRSCYQPGHHNTSLPGPKYPPLAAARGGKRRWQTGTLRAALRLFVIASAIRPADLPRWLAPPICEHTPGRCE